MPTEKEVSALTEHVKTVADAGENGILYAIVLAVLALLAFLIWRGFGYLEKKNIQTDGDHNRATEKTHELLNMALDHLRKVESHVANVSETIERSATTADQSRERIASAQKEIAADLRAIRETQAEMRVLLKR